MSLKANEQHDDEQISDVQARRGGIEADVSCYRATVERLGDLVGVLVRASRATEGRRAVHEIAWHKNRLRENQLICLPSPSVSASANGIRVSRASLLLWVCFVASFAAGLGFASWAMVCRAGRCPPAQALQDYEPRQTSKLLAVDGRFIAELGLERRTLVKIADIPPLVRSAFIVTEDKRFFGHAGIDWHRVPGALLVDIKNRNFAEGFSTITMQLARNIFPERISRDKSVIRKLKEAKVARDIESRYSKEKILELYLNQIYLGNGAYGIEAASQRYFGKTLKELNLAEAATLAALPKGPERYNPRQFPGPRRSASQHRHRLDAR